MDYKKTQTQSNCNSTTELITAITNFRTSTTPVYINDSLCSYYKMFWQKCEILWSSEFIYTFWVSSGFVKLKITDNDRVYTIIHNNDLEELFPGNKLLLESG